MVSAMGSLCGRSKGYRSAWRNGAVIAFLPRRPQPLPAGEAGASADLHLPRALSAGRRHFLEVGRADVDAETAARGAQTLRPMAGLLVGAGLLLVVAGLLVQLGWLRW